MQDITRILAEVESGDLSSAEQLLPLMYDELRKLAAARLIQERPGHTLQATALVHEAWLRLFDAGGHQTRWQSRGHFFAAAAEAMRRILVDQAQRRNRLRHGGAVHHIPLDELTPIAVTNESSTLDLLALSDALDELAAADPVKAELVKLRYFAGLSLEDAAHALGISEASAKRYWVYARSWLFGRLSRE